MTVSITSSGAADKQPCQFCGMLHGIKCPDVKALEYFPNGTLKRVEFYTPAEKLVLGNAAGGYYSIANGSGGGPGAPGGHAT